MVGIRQNGRCAFGCEHKPVAAQQQRISITQRARQCLAVGLGFDVAGLAHHQHARRPPDGMEVHDFHLGTLGQGHRGGEFHMIMDDGADIRPRAVDLGMNHQFAGRFVVTLDHIAVEIHQ